MSRIAILLLSIQLLVAATKDWKMAVFTETHKTGGPADQRAYTFDLGDTVIVCVDPPLRIRIHPVDIAVGSNVPYARVSSSQLIVKDRRGKQQRLNIQQETLKSSGKH